jgi:hypothetical protein
MKRIILILVLVLPIAVVSAKAASGVSFDFTDGHGFVSKSAIAGPFDLSNGEVKKLASKVSFRVVERYTSDVYCDSGAQTVQVEEVYYNVTSEVSGPPGQFTGWKLTGLTDGGGTFPIPIEDLCDGPGTKSDLTTVRPSLYGQLAGYAVVLIP